MESYLFKYLCVCLVVVVFPFVLMSCTAVTGPPECTPFILGTAENLSGEIYTLRVEEQDCPRIDTFRKYEEIQ